MPNQQNTFERLSDDLRNWYAPERKRLSNEMMGGKTPPWMHELKTDDEIYELHSKLSPAEAQQRWETYDEKEREKVARIMNSRSRPQQA